MYITRASPAGGAINICRCKQVKQSMASEKPDPALTIAGPLPRLDPLLVRAFSEWSNTPHTCVWRNSSSSCWYSVQEGRETNCCTDRSTIRNALWWPLRDMISSTGTATARGAQRGRFHMYNINSKVMDTDLSAQLGLVCGIIFLFKSDVLKLLNLLNHNSSFRWSIWLVWGRY